MSNYYVAGEAGAPTTVAVGRTGRYVRVQLAGTNYLTLSEVEVFDNAQASSTGGEVNWLITDHLGTPRMVADLSGSLASIKRHDYLPFGEEIGAGVGGRTTNQGYGQIDGNRKKWAQLERDVETGLDYAQARYYSSTQGRFTSVDPENAGTELENPQSWNGYAYALNNPTVNVDPDGLKVKLYDRDRKFIGEIEDEEANAGLFNREWQRKNGHRVRQGVIYDNNDTVIGYYENTCCDWLAGSSNESVVQQLSSGEAFDRAVPGAILNTVTSGLTRGSTPRTRGLWEITKAGTDKVLKHRSFGTFSRHKSTGLWWSKDRAGHGQSKWKVYRETSKGLEHVADADEYGDFILNKHKGSVGEFIPWKELSGK